jgi:hypothetical protein
MHCLTPNEAKDVLESAGFRVSSADDRHRMELAPEPTVVAGQIRIGARPTPHVDRLCYFAEGRNRWLPSNRHRLLWVDNWTSDFPSAFEFFIAARIGLGETRSLFDAPGHYFDPYPYGELNQTQISPEQARQTGILIGLMSLIMINGWDAWLIAAGSSERIEFWEGNIFFHSHEPSRVAEATVLLDQFDCPRDLA